MTAFCEEFVPLALRDDHCGEWFVIHSRSRQEKWIEEDCACLGVAAYLPLLTSVRCHRGRKLVSELPMFPGYLFVRGTRERVFELDRRRRMAAIIRVADQQRLHRELSNLHRVTSRQGRLQPYPYLHAGMRVEVRSGAFRGVQGVVSSLADNRLTLQVRTLGQAVGLEIDGSLLEPIRESEWRETERHCEGSHMLYL